MSELKCVLVVTDLEGVSGVTDLDALTATTRKYKNACRALACELSAVCRGLLERGVERIVISDSHRGGSANGNLDPSSLPSQCEVVYGEDAFKADLFVGVDALIAIGMHGAAGTTSFAAHTVGLHCDWWRGGQRLSESDILLALANEAGVPSLYIAGDAELGQSLAGQVAFLTTKSSLSVAQCQSLSIADTEPEFYRLAFTALPQLVCNDCANCAGQEPILLGFKSAWQAELAESVGRALGVTRIGSHWVSTAGNSFREHYSLALQMVEATASPLFESWNCAFASPRFLWSVRQLFLREFPPNMDRGGASSLLAQVSLNSWDLKSRIEAAWSQFDKLTCTATGEPLTADGEFSLALRALVLHIGKTWCPKAFERLGLAAPLAQALERLAEIPQSYPPELPASQAMARIDAIYILGRERLSCPKPRRLQLKAYLEKLAYQHTILAWMIAELARLSACSVGLHFSERPYLAADPGAEAEDGRHLWDLYWVAHQLFFASDYLTSATPVGLSIAFAEELLNSIPWVIEKRHWDLGVEIGLCLLYLGEANTANIRGLAGEVFPGTPMTQPGGAEQVLNPGSTPSGTYPAVSGTPGFNSLLQALLNAQSSDGCLRDESMLEMAESLDDHATGLLLLLLARIDEGEGLNHIS